jgi:membrane associated rhomboid family serine protease
MAPTGGTARQDGPAEDGTAASRGGTAPPCGGTAAPRGGTAVPPTVAAPRVTGTGSGRETARKVWGLSQADAESILAEARRALIVMVALLAVIWVLQVVNWADHYRLTLDFGIRPRQAGSLPDVFTAPLLHFSWAHIEGNSGPLFIFGFLAAYRGIARFAGVTMLIVLASGLSAWLAEAQNTVGAGASGLVFGYFGYIMVRGFFDRHVIDIVVGAVMALCFAYQFTVLLPHAGIGWQAHIGGLAGGVLAGWIFRERRRPRASGRPRAAPAVGA